MKQMNHRMVFLIYRELTIRAHNSATKVDMRFFLFFFCFSKLYFWFGAKIIFYAAVCESHFTHSLYLPV